MNLLRAIERVRARLEALVMANAAPRCGARSKRTGKPCRAAAMPNGRCKVHGGKSTGPRTLEGLERIAPRGPARRCNATCRGWSRASAACSPRSLCIAPRATIRCPCHAWRRRAARRRECAALASCCECAGHDRARMSVRCENCRSPICRRDRSSEPQMAKGLDFDVFTGAAHE
jgi:hypothetical protein